MALFEDVVAANQVRDLRAYFSGIRAMYAIVQPQIDAGIHRPNFCEWGRIFSPIEREAWIDIQQYRLTMFPQYPALSFFLDFADPWAKVAIECDGALWHDAARDKARDDVLRRAGWQVWRITGKEIWKDSVDDENAEETDVVHWINVVRDMSQLRRDG